MEETDRLTPRKTRPRGPRLRTQSMVLGVLLGAPLFVFAEPVRLNNLVTQLGRFDLKPTAREGTFELERDGWVHFATVPTSPGVEIRLQHTGEIGSSRILSSTEIFPGSWMRYLQSGDYRFEVASEETFGPFGLVIRAVPELHYCRYPVDPVIAEYGPYDWDRVKRDILPWTNTIDGHLGPKVEAELDQWTGSGRKWIDYGSLPKQVGLTADQAFHAWADRAGFTDPRAGGLIADEFQGRHSPYYPAWIGGVEKLGAAFAGTGKWFYGYCGGPGMYTRPQPRAVVETIFRNDFRMAWERYLHEVPTLSEGQEYIQQMLPSEMAKWRQTFPGCESRLVIVLAWFNSGFSLAVRPDTDFKVWMDLQMQVLATDPEFAGLFGLQCYTADFTDDEIFAWLGQLYRHYAIEGNTELLSNRYGYEYELKHIRNPEFDQSLEGWKVEPASEGSVRWDYMEHYSRLQGRYWHRNTYPDEPAGNTFLMMKRSAVRPNLVSQPIQGLVPGRLYSVKAMVADYRDILAGTSEAKDLGFHLEIEGGERIDNRSFVARTDSSRASLHPDLPFSASQPAHFNFHRWVFRASGETGSLTLTDWNQGSIESGAVGQELMVNFVEVQPFFEGESAGAP